MRDMKITLDDLYRAEASPGPSQDGRVERLEAELVRSEQRLHAALSDVMAANDELRSSNDDQQGLNEELRVANEELAASESELQALNGELGKRVDELAEANADMRNVIESTRIAIVFLDEALRIRDFTPAMRDVLHLRQADRGRPITDLVLQVAYPGLADDARRVLRSLRPVERQAGHVRTGAQFLVRVLPYFGAGEQAEGVVVTFLDITPTVAAERALRASEERFRRMAAAVPALLFIAGPEAEWDYVNPPFYELTGQEEGGALGQGWTGALHPDDAAANRAAWVLACAGGGTLEHEARLRRADGSWCWFLIRAVPQHDPSGSVVRWYGSCTDIDERRRAEKRQGQLLAEVQHRTRNTLAVVRSMLTRTLESTTDLDHFASHLAGRIGALARTQTSSACTAEGLVVLEHLVSQELAAEGGLDERQIRVAGPLVSLPLKIADAIGLAIHELTTNSIKWGALAAPSGIVEVTWAVGAATDAAGGLLRLEWRESGVPLTDLQPKHRGFGRELIEQGLPYEFGATTTMAFRPGGLHCTIALRLPTAAALRAGLVPWR